MGVPGGLNSSGTAEYCGDKGWGGRLSGSGDAQASRQRAKVRPEYEKTPEETKRWGGTGEGEEETW